MRGFVPGDVLDPMLGIRSRPFRIVLGLQLTCTAFLAGLGGWVSEAHGALSAALGGAIGVVGGLSFAWMAGRSQAATADGVLVSALKAEGVKVALFIALLALVLAVYKNVVIVWLIGSFIASTMIFGFALFVRDA